MGWAWAYGEKFLKAKLEGPVCKFLKKLRGGQAHMNGTPMGMRYILLAFVAMGIISYQTIIFLYVITNQSLFINDPWPTMREVIR